MPVISQKNRPIGLVVLDTSPGLSLASIPAFHLFSPRPEEVSYGHPSRGTVIQTFDGGFVDDFGEGLCDINIKGHTGWNGDLLPGEVKFYSLRDLITLGYHARRKAKIAASLPIESVRMFLVDTLNLFVYEVYPLQFNGEKSKASPLLYRYTLRMTGIKRNFGMADLFSGSGLGALGDLGGQALAGVQGLRGLLP